MDNTTSAPPQEATATPAVYSQNDIDNAIDGTLHQLNRRKGGIDLNDANPQPPDDAVEPARYDLDEIKRKLADRAAEIYPPRFKHARLSADGRELRMANVHGDAPRGEGSCLLNLRGEYAGCIHDFATDEHADQLDALSYATGLTGRELYEYAARLVGSTPSKPKANGKAEGHDDKKARDIAFILQHCEPARGSLVEDYLKSRGLDLPDCPDLLFHPNLTDWEAKRGRPAMVAVVRDPMTAQPTGGIHRTYLAEDGSGKAEMPKAKMMLGHCDGVVKLLPMGEDGVLGIAEGQETALAAATMFHIAVWAGLSAGGVRHFKFPPGLRQLTIFADKGKDGEKAAWDLYHRALTAGIQAFVVLPRSDDDFAEDLVLGYSVTDYQPETFGTLEPATGPKPLELILFRDMRARIEDRTIVGDLLNEREMSAVVGASGTGKTFLVIDMALHIAGRRSWFNRPTQQTGVVYIAAEAGRGIVNRVAAYKKHYPDIPADLPFAAIVSPVNLRDALATNGFYEVLAAIEGADLGGVPVGLIIVDTLSRAMAGGDENGSADMGAFVENMDKLREKTGAHVLIVHHVGKDASRGARGHSLFHAAVDTEITVTRDSGTGISTATITKQRELPTMGRINYRMRSVELGRDQNDRPVTSCIVEAADEADAGNGKAKPRLAAAQKHALDLLVDAVARHGQIPPVNDRIPAKVHCVRETYWRECCYQGQISESDNQDAKQKAFKRAANDLLAKNRIGKWGEWVWPVL